MGSMMETFLRLVNGSDNQNKIIALHIKYVKMYNFYSDLLLPFTSLRNVSIMLPIIE